MEQEQESPQNLSDEVLLKRSLAGESEAFGLLYDKYALAICRNILFKSGNQETAEDVANQAFLQVWEYLRNGKTIRSFRAFLYRTANNIFIDLTRKKESKNLSLDEMSETQKREPADQKEEKELEVESAEEIVILKQALQSMPVNYREIITLRYLDELTISEIAKVTGKNSGTVYVSLYRGIKALRRALVEAQKPKNNLMLK